ncbi:MAG: pyridoxamine 5'-phosphate oxidase family protein [Actinomycetota bacterium]|nr:pyridoxamine 5'-phosphate oxidase family protein [Actinomycetota bacterium]
MAKADITMTPAEVDAFLARCPQMVVGALDADGWPTGTLARCTYADGALSLHVQTGDPVLQHLARDPRVCCTADEHATYFEIQGVTVLGTAALPAAWQAVGDGRIGEVVVSVAVDRIVSFDFGRLRPQQGD